jgi:hypothetical protein
MLRMADVGFCDMVSFGIVVVGEPADPEPIVVMAPPSTRVSGMGGALRCASRDE